MNRKQIVMLMLVAVVALPIQAMQRSPEPLPIALADATLVVHATVESAEAAWAEDEWGRHIWTTYELRVERMIKGQYDGEVVSLRIIGGSVGDRTEMVFDVPRPYFGQEAVFVLEARRVGGPFSVNRSLPVVDGAVILGSGRVPVDRFAGAVAQLISGNPAPLKAITPLPRLSVRPQPSDANQTPQRSLTATGAGMPSEAKILAVASLWDAWWENGVDNDGDGYYQSADLIWDADVDDGVSSLSVYFEVFNRPAGGSEWTSLGSVGPHTITGSSYDDVYGVTITGDGDPAMYDFAVAVYQSGASQYDDVRYPEDDAELSMVPLEGAANDGGGGGTAPTINSVSPQRASAGTGDQVTITGSGFGSNQGQVRFSFQNGQDGMDTVSADIVSWADTRIVCTVPICRFAQGECGGYPGGSSSGPMWVITAGGGQSAPTAFEVPFGYGGQKWNPTIVNYQIANGVPAEFKAAVENAFATWTAAAGLTFNFSGATNATVPSNNGTTEITYGPLPDGLPEGVIAFANCWPSNAAIINECDVLFNQAMPWSTAATTPGDSFDVEAIALHEFGHWLVLLDLYGMEQGYPSDMNKVMFGTSSYGPDWAKRVLHADDLAGVRWIYPGGGPSCTYSISPSNATIATSGGTGTVSVTAGAGCAWTATSNRAWITVTSGASGSGNGSVRFSVAANSGGARSGSLTIAGKTFTVNQSGTGGGGTCAHSYWVPIAARLAGQGGSNWRTDLGLLSTGSGSATIEVRLYTGSGTLNRSTSLSPGATTILRDVVNWLSAGYSGAGAVQVCSSGALEVMARIYTLEASGKTLGQAFVGVSGTETLSSGQTAVLPMLTQNGNAGAIGTYRTNIGVVNGGSSGATVRITLHDNNGNQVGAALTRTYASGEVHQYSAPFASAGRNNIDAGYAQVTVNSGSGVYAYGSVLDNGSNDPTTIGMR